MAEGEDIVTDRVCNSIDFSGESQYQYMDTLGFTDVIMVHVVLGPASAQTYEMRFQRSPDHTERGYGANFP